MITRRVYRMLLMLYPSAFRERFANEMLWVFDQMTTAERRCVLRDGVVSLNTQWAATGTVPRVATPFGPIPETPFPAVRLAQATALAALLTLGFFKLLTQGVPLPKPARNFSQQRRAAWALCRVYRGGAVRHAGDPADCEALW